MAAKRPYLTVFVCALLALAAGTCAALTGPYTVHFGRALSGAAPDREILFDLRLPRALLALWTGGALALSGVLLQALLRNPLATSYTLGVSGGASLGAVAAILAGWGTVGRIPGVTLAACVGSALVLLLLLVISNQGSSMSPVSLLLAGVTVETMCGAAILFLSSMAGFLKSFAVTRWLMGGLDPPDYRSLIILTVLLTPVCLLVFRYGGEWNLLAVGDRWAATRGVSPRRLLLVGCIASAILTGAVTALAGPIGFVGLIVPHVLRLTIGADHRTLAPCSFFIGGAFLALCDIVARLALAPVEIPVGVITAITGGPVFIWMLRRGTLRRVAP